MSDTALQSSANPPNPPLPCQNDEASHVIATGTCPPGAISDVSRARGADPAALAIDADPSANAVAGDADPQQPCGDDIERSHRRQHSCLDPQRHRKDLDRSAAATAIVGESQSLGQLAAQVQAQARAQAQAQVGSPVRSNPCVRPKGADLFIDTVADSMEIGDTDAGSMANSVTNTDNSGWGCGDDGVGGTGGGSGGGGGGGGTALCTPGTEATGRWTTKEHETFLLALKLHGREWKKVAAMVQVGDASLQSFVVVVVVVRRHSTRVVTYDA